MLFRNGEKIHWIDKLGNNFPQKNGICTTVENVLSVWKVNNQKSFLENMLKLIVKVSHVTAHMHILFI